MLEDLKKVVCEANLDMVAKGLVMLKFGNVSGIDFKSGLFVIKPPGVDYKLLKPEQMVVVSLETGEVVEGDLNPSSDTPTYLVLYRAFKSVGGVVHTHSHYAASWAQAQCEIPELGTTHADYCHGPVPCTHLMSDQEILANYEANTGHVIVERFDGLTPHSCPFVLVVSHGRFTWDLTVMDAVENAEVLEYLARLASERLHICSNAKPMQATLLEKHFSRKHGSEAYYGQKRLVEKDLDVPSRNRDPQQLEALRGPLSVRPC